MPKEIDQIRFYQQIEFDRSNLIAALKNIENKLAQKIEEINYFDPLEGEKININGEYITTYEDSNNGKIIYKKAPAILKNIRSRIKGKTNFGDKQIWKMKGSIDKEKRIVGKYWAIGEIDNGMGTFYLQPTSPSILEGFWCGYDNENKRISSGKYIFRKIFKNFKILDLQKNHCPYLIKIADEGLGKNYLNSNFFNQCINKKDGLICKVVINNQTNKPIGFCTYKIINQNEIALIVKNEDGINELKYHDKCGLIKSVVIDKRYSGYGVASSLVNYCLKELEKTGISIFISTAWKHVGVTNIGNVLSNCKFIKYKEIPQYWYEDSIKNKYNCPQCGNPCTCSCVIFIKY